MELYKYRHNSVLHPNNAFHAAVEAAAKREGQPEGLEEPQRELLPHEYQSLDPSGEGLRQTGKMAGNASDCGAHFVRVHYLNDFRSYLNDEDRLADPQNNRNEQQERIPNMSHMQFEDGKGIAVISSTFRRGSDRGEDGWLTLRNKFKTLRTKLDMDPKAETPVVCLRLQDAVLGRKRSSRLMDALGPGDEVKFESDELCGNEITLKQVTSLPPALTSGLSAPHTHCVGSTCV